MKLSELIVHVGDEHVKEQILADDITNVQMRKSGEAMVTFGTTAINATQVATDTVPYVGLVIWLPKERMPPKAVRS